MTAKNYLRILFFILIMIMASTVSYAYYFSKNYSKNFPLPLTNRISLDAKLKFIRENIDPETIDTLIVGSSLSLNNVQGKVLEKNSKNIDSVLNLAVWSIGSLQVQQLLELSDAFPNLERIVYSGQFSDFANMLLFKNYDSDYLQKYITNSMNPIEYSHLLLNVCKDIAFCKKREKEWKNDYNTSRKFSFLRFDDTGSAPLEIRGKDRIQARWKNPHGGLQYPQAFKALQQIAQKAKKDNINFYFVQQPYRQPLIDKHAYVKKVMKTFATNVNTIVSKEGGNFFNLHEKVHFSDVYFADRSHLNSNGSKIGSEEIAKFIDSVESTK